MDLVTSTLAVSDIYGSLWVFYSCGLVTSGIAPSSSCILQALLLPSGEGARAAFIFLLLATSPPRAASFTFCHVCLSLTHYFGRTSEVSKSELLEEDFVHC